jgi:gamma-glutamylcyclotransferase (GGCT)/AIG2-like uncharacterized protein YtfP
MTPLFLYGTLLDRRRLARISGDPRLARATRPATLNGHARVRCRGTPYPTLIPAAAAVAGRLLRPTPAALRRLAAYEGPLYRLIPVTVATPGGPRRARAWCVPRRLADATLPWPPATRAGAAGSAASPTLRSRRGRAPTAGR